MGYDIRIGNAVPVHHKDDFPRLSARWEVEGATSAGAPVFEGDEMTGNSNMRSPSYSAWSEFCEQTGLYPLFYDEDEGLLAQHPGCVGITQNDADAVTQALVHYRSTVTLPPGFEKDWDHEGPPNFDYHYARLIWLEYWMQWAVKNCETPAIQNT